MREGIVLGDKLATVADLRQADDLLSNLGAHTLGYSRDSDRLIALNQIDDYRRQLGTVISSVRPLLRPLGPAPRGLARALSTVFAYREPPDGEHLH